MNRRSGFTLIELLVVMGIMVLLMGISTLGILGMRRGAELRGAAMSMRTTLMLARQQAVTKRQNVRVEIAADRMTVSYPTSAGSTNRTLYFTPGITVTPDEPTITFSPSGSVEGGAGTPTNTITDKSPGGGSKRIVIWKLTGASKEL